MYSNTKTKSKLSGPLKALAVIAVGGACAVGGFYAKQLGDKARDAYKDMEYSTVAAACEQINVREDFVCAPVAKSIDEKVGADKQAVPTPEKKENQEYAGAKQDYNTNSDVAQQKQMIQQMIQTLQGMQKQ